MKTTFEVEILEDGTISVKTSEIAQKDHKAADDFLEMLEDLAGGKMKSTPVEHPFWKNKNVLKGGKIVEVK